jgi:hypothetical protein
MKSAGGLGITVFEDIGWNEMSSKDWTMSYEESCLLREDTEGEGVFFAPEFSS